MPFSFKTDKGIRYWSKHTVHVESKSFHTRMDSLKYFDWRCSEYPGYLDLMPVNNKSNLSILDFGCGPGHDLVGFLEYSKPKNVIAVDVSAKALKIAKKRTTLHPGGKEIQFIKSVDSRTLNVQSESIDYIHSSGVLHHILPMGEVMKELGRLLKKDGKMRIMVYNRNSIWRQLYCTYVLQQVEKSIDGSLSPDEAFKRSTDGPDCPISNSYTFDELRKLGETYKLKAQLIGTSISKHELDIFSRFYDRAMGSDKIDLEGKQFLSELVNINGVPTNRDGLVAGINLVVEFSKS